MMQVPLYSNSQKIGESGRIDWFKTGKFVEFRESSWMNDKLELKQKIEYEIFMLRDSLNLNKDYRKTRLASLVLFVALLAYIILINVLIPSISDGNSDTSYVGMIIVAYAIFVVICIAVLVFQIYTIRKMLQLVRLGIVRLNEKIRGEGINAYIAFKPETRLQKCCGDMTRLKIVEVFEYVNY